MDPANPHTRAAWAAPKSGAGRHALRGAPLGCLFVLIGTCCIHATAFAQTTDSRPVEPPPKALIVATYLKSDDMLPERVPVRIIESHNGNLNRKQERRSIEIGGTDGHFAPYQEIESETLSADGSTMKTTTRTFGRDVNGTKALVQVTEEEKRIRPSDESSIVRVTYNPDVNGRLQAVQRDIVETKKIGAGLEETCTTTMLPNINGGLVPAFKTHELRKLGANDTVEIEKTTWLPDTNGKWQLGEVRSSTATQETNGRSTEERVFRPDAEGKLGQISRAVSQETDTTNGEKRSVVETYSVDVPGTTRDGDLHLVERMTTTERSTSNGQRATEQRVEQTDPGDTRSGLRVSVLIDGKVVPGLAAEQSTVTIRARDSNGSLGIVSVSTTQADGIPAAQIQQSPAERPN